MVELSRSIANKIKEKHGNITEDEVGGRPRKPLVDTTTGSHCLLLKYPTSERQGSGGVRMLDSRTKCTGFDSQSLQSLPVDVGQIHKSILRLF